jgi:transcription termination/antitermination protein NusG
VSSALQVADWTSSIAAASVPNWYAIQTRSRHEKVVAYQLQMKSVTHYLPIVTEVRKWSDRSKKVELPLFSCYVFAQIVPTNEARVSVLKTDGVVRFIGQHGEGTVIPDEQIQSIRILLEQDVPCTSYPFLKVGQRVRVRGGALDGVEGIFQSSAGDDTLIVSIDAIQRSMAVRIKGYDIDIL